MAGQIAKYCLVLGLLTYSSVPAYSQVGQANSVAGVQSLLNFDIKVYLEGANTGGTPAQASTISGEAYFPLAQPYGGSEFDGTPMKYSGSEAISVSPPAGTIDWVLVEIRTNGTARTDSATTVAALLMEDGSIRATDGTSLPLALVETLGTHYVVVRHRNHMPVLSSGTVDFSSGTPVQYDFTTALAQGFGANPMKQIGSVFAMYGADPNGQDGVTAADKSPWVTQNGGPNGYREADYDLDGIVSASDKSFWVTNNGISSPVPGN